MACRAKAVGDCALMKGIAPSRLPDSESGPSAIRVEPCLVRIQTANHAKNAKGKSLFACFEYSPSFLGMNLRRQIHKYLFKRDAQVSDKFASPFRGIIQRQRRKMFPELGVGGSTSKGRGARETLNPPASEG